MSKPVVGILLAVVAVLLVIGYIGVIPGRSEPRAVPTATAGTGGGDGSDPAVVAGEAIYQAQCAACHSIDGSDGVGPTWQGLYESTIELDDGTTVVADDEYIAQAIVDPNAQIHAGYQAVMPAFPLTEQEINEVIAYIKTLN